MRARDIWTETRVNVIWKLKRQNKRRSVQGQEKVDKVFCRQGKRRYPVRYQRYKMGTRRIIKICIIILTLDVHFGQTKQTHNKK